MAGAPHLDEARWAAFLAGRLPPGERAAVAAHLETDCEACEAFLATLDAPDALDGAADDALLGMAARKPQSDDLGFARVRRELEGRKTRALWWPGLGLVAGLALFLVIGRREEPDPSRLKGPPPGATVRLEVLRSDPARGLSLLTSGSTVAQGDLLVFRVHLSAPACVQLSREVGEGPEDLLPAPRCLPAGKSVLEANGEALGLRVGDERKLELWISAGDERARVRLKRRP